MAGTQTVRPWVKGKSRLRTDRALSGSESCSGMHNPKVEGSNPSPAPRWKGLNQMVQAFFQFWSVGIRHPALCSARFLPC